MIKNTFNEFLKEYFNSITDVLDASVVCDFRTWYIENYEYKDYGLFNNFCNNYLDNQDSLRRYMGILQKIAHKSDKILDVGCGNLCTSSAALIKMGYDVEAIDPLIDVDIAKTCKIPAYNKYFLCDDFSNDSYQGFNIENYDLVVGHRPCSATEHILRQCKKYDKKFFLELCHCCHPPLDKLNSVGKDVFCASEKYDFLKSLSKDFDIITVANNVFITNLEPAQTAFIEYVPPFLDPTLELD